VVGPAAAVLPKARGLFRYHAIVKVNEPDSNLDAVLAQLHECSLPKSIRFQINVDPYDLF
jgi:primosomal protein N'